MQTTNLASSLAADLKKLDHEDLHLVAVVIYELLRLKKEHKPTQGILNYLS